MPAILLLHGPNLNALGRRDPEHYGSLTLDQLVAKVRGWAESAGLEVHAFQSNHEGALIDKVQEAASWASGAIVNLGAYTHTSYALHDALLDLAKPVIEVHLSAISEREEWRQKSVIAPACRSSIEGKGADGYKEAVEALKTLIE